MEKEFEPYDLEEFESSAIGKTITDISVDDSGLNNKLVFNFTDGTSLRIEYDWLYTWEVR